MPKTKDRFEIVPRLPGERVIKGWRVERSSSGLTGVFNLRTSRSTHGVDDGFGNLVWPSNFRSVDETQDEIVPYYR